MVVHSVRYILKIAWKKNFHHVFPLGYQSLRAKYLQQRSLKDLWGAWTLWKRKSTRQIGFQSKRFRKMEKSTCESVIWTQNTPHSFSEPAMTQLHFSDSSPGGRGVLERSIFAGYVPTALRTPSSLWPILWPIIDPILFTFGGMEFSRSQRSHSTLKS